MKLNFSYLHSKVGKRVFWLFFISAALPIVISAIVSFTYITDLLIQQATSQLHHSSKLYGMSVFDRLLLIEEELRNTAETINSRVDWGPDELKNKLGGSVNNLVIVNVNNNTNILFNKSNSLVISPEGDRDLAKSNRSRLYSVVDTVDESKIYMQIMLHDKSSSSKKIIAELNSEYLWGKKDELRFSSFICVIESAKTVLFCSHPTSKLLPEVARNYSDEGTTNVFSWENHDEKYLAVNRELFVRSRFDVPRWNIVASQKESKVLLPVDTFIKVFPLLMFLSLLTVLLLSAIQIRRNMVPLGKLMEGTRKLANQEFGETVDINSNDEFEELANSFNLMSVRLNKQINAMQVLSEIDDLILKNPNIKEVIELMLYKARNVMPCDFTAITLMDDNAGNTGWTYIVGSTQDKKLFLEKTKIPEDEKEFILNTEGAFSIDLQKVRWHSLEHHQKRGCMSIQVFRIILDDKLRAIFEISHRIKPVAHEGDLAHILDITDRLAVALAAADRDDKLLYQAHYDPLTDLPNRQMLVEYLNKKITASHSEETKLGILYIDLDRFKIVNDSYGHTMGDKALRIIAGKMKNAINETDIVARMEGDEFIIVLTNITNKEEVGSIAEHIIRSISAPFLLETREINITSSIGISLFPEDGSDEEELFKHADAAMLRAKTEGRGKYLFFEEKMNTEDMVRVEMDRDLHQALKNEQFHLLYQPQLDIQTMKVIGVEALIRWQHPEWGLVPPDRFIPLAEDTGLIESIGDWVLTTACQQFREWQDMGLSLERMAVNVSSRQFLNADFINTIAKTLLKTNIAAQNLELEVTESLLVEERVNPVVLLNELHNMGIRLAIDDFGTGYSSLSYLKLYPLDILKIDKSFVSDIPGDENATTITNSIIALAHALNLEVVAEGIENIQQLEFLRKQNCQIGQGFYFNQPLTADEFVEYMLKQNHEMAGIKGN